MEKCLSILGSTGSIGCQTLDVCRENNIRVIGLSAGNNIDLLERQVKEFKPMYVCIANQALESELKERLRGYDVEVFSGKNGLEKIASLEEANLVVSAIVGIAGLAPTYKAITTGHDVALANKETLVAAGEIIMAEVAKKGVKILPIDSEHSAIFQCLYGNNKKDIDKIILTASGGPFRGKSYEFLREVTPKMALNHPNWAMGNKITIDSATLMNKGFEVIEAKWLFGIDVEKIKVLVHPQSIVHSMVSYVDGVIMAQLGTADMRIPISHAILYPNRVKNSFPKLNLLENNNLTFEEPDIKTFECLKIAYDAISYGGLMPAILNTANEIAVDLFLNGKIRFTDIPNIIKDALNRYENIQNPTIDDVLGIDKKIRSEIKR